MVSRWVILVWILWWISAWLKGIFFLLLSGRFRLSLWGQMSCRLKKYYSFKIVLKLKFPQISQMIIEYQPFCFIFEKLLMNYYKSQRLLNNNDFRCLKIKPQPAVVDQPFLVHAALLKFCLLGILLNPHNLNFFFTSCTKTPHKCLDISVFLRTFQKHHKN